MGILTTTTHFYYDCDSSWYSVLRNPNPSHDGNLNLTSHGTVLSSTTSTATATATSTVTTATPNNHTNEQQQEQHQRQQQKKHKSLFLTMSFPGLNVQRAWHLVDASNQRVGRLAHQISILLRGKHKPTFLPGADIGDYVVVVNADKVRRLCV